MTLITMPSRPVPAKIDWSFSQPSQANRSEFNGRRRVTMLPDSPRRYATVTLPPILGEEAVLAWRVFVESLQGVANSFKLIAVERPQIDTFQNVVVDGAGQTGFALATRGWHPGERLKAGNFATPGEQLLLLTQPVVASAQGKATLTCSSYVREGIADGTAVETRRPFAVMSMSDPKNGWSVGIGQNYAISFSCEESY